ncbi:MAG: ExbD/TolR family protein [Ruegeria sp.]
MSGELVLNRRKPTRPLISLVPMIDVMLILLVFFMVTSTYLNLDMIPALSQQDRQPPSDATEGGQPAGAMLIRIGADGAAYFQGRPFEQDALAQMLANRLAVEPAVQVIILPTGSARMQALVSVMDTVTTAGVTNMRVVRLEARP